MSLADQLRSKRESILERWLHAVVATYPSESSDHLLNQRDRFHNPVGDALRRGLPILLAVLIGDDDDGLDEAVGEIVRIRTVQCEKPSQAIAWVFALKAIAREEAGDASGARGVAGEWIEFDARVDGLALMMCDEFLKCKEVIGEIRVREAQRRSAKLVEQVNRLYGGVEENRDSDVDNKSNAGNL